MPNHRVIPCPAGTQAYFVKAGDTLFALARRFNTIVEGIVQVNTGLDPANLQIGQRICIPIQVPPAPTPTPTPTPQPTPTPVCPEGNPYTVKAGDTMYKIAKFFNISLDDLIEANPLINPAALTIGQVICIPLATPPVQCGAGAVPYVIKSGDTFYKIAQQNNISLNALIAANPNVDPQALLIGQTICIPRDWATYTNRTYNVSFSYPSNWKRVNDLRYVGSDGFFQISAIASTATLEEVCENEATHQLLPYGTDPVITRLTVNGQNACIIFPSSDQPVQMRGQAALIVRYPNPVRIGTMDYNYFILWTDKELVKEIAGTLRFI